MPAPLPFDPEAFPSLSTLPDRAEVRALVARMGADMVRATRAGGNAHHVGLDYEDRVRQAAVVVAARSGPQAAALLLALWSEETAAWAAHMRESAATAEAVAVARWETQQGSWGWWMLGILALVALLAWLLPLLASAPP